MEQPSVSASAASQPTKIDDGGPAFPCMTDGLIVEPGAGKVIPIYRGGMTLRDYFAARVMEAIVRTTSSRTLWQATRRAFGFRNVTESAEATSTAAVAYRQADAMLAARKAGGAL